MEVYLVITPGNLGNGLQRSDEGLLVSLLVSARNLPQQCIHLDYQLSPHLNSIHTSCLSTRLTFFPESKGWIVQARCR